MTCKTPDPRALDPRCLTAARAFGAEKDAMSAVLAICLGQELPLLRLKSTFLPQLGENGRAGPACR